MPKFKLGRDCLFANDVIFRTHDSHHIFDGNTHRHVNVPKDISVGNNVWIAYCATLLGRAVIEAELVVGTCAITSSELGKHQIIAESPARVLRENICWSRDDTAYFNHDYLEECISQDALKYMEG